jgi:hypothetical protein
MTKSFPGLALLAVIFLTLSTGVHAECYDVFGCSDRNYFRANDLGSGPINRLA